MCQGSDVSSASLGLQGAGTLMSTVSSYQKSKLDKEAYNIQGSNAETNAMLDDVRSRDAKARGDINAQTSELRTKALLGKQAAQFAANGVVLDYGSPLSTLTDTSFMGGRDAQLIRDNAAKEAWGYDVMATNDRNNAALLRRRAGVESPGRAATTTLLTSAGSVASSWYNMRRRGTLDDNF